MTSYTQSGQFFFHYTTREAAFPRILPERRLRLSPCSRMRDPLEAKAPALASGLTVPEDPGVQEEMGRAYFEARDEIARLRRQTKLLSLTIDAPGYDANTSPTLGVAGPERACGSNIPSSIRASVCSFVETRSSRWCSHSFRSVRPGLARERSDTARRAWPSRPRRRCYSEKALPGHRSRKNTSAALRRNSSSRS